MCLVSNKQKILSTLSKMNHSKGSKIPQDLKQLKEELSKDEYKILIYGNKKVSDYCNLVEEINCWSIKSILDYWKNIREELDEETYQSILIEL